MLKVLRDNLKYLSWILWVVILVFIAFVFVDFGGGLSRDQGAPAAAQIGGHAISRREFERLYRQLEERYRQAFGERWNAELAERFDLPSQALQQLVDRRLLLDEAERQEIRVGDEEIRRSILELDGLTDAAGNYVGEEEYLRFVRGYGYSPREFEDRMREDLTIARFSTLLEKSVAVSDTEVERSWRESNETAAIRYLLAPIARFRAAATPAELEAYFSAHADELILPDQRLVDYLLVDAIKIRSAMTFERAELERVYQTRIAEFAQPEQLEARHILVKVDEKRSADEARRRIEQARVRLAKGESFQKLAGELSDDPGSREKGGDLGRFGRGAMVPPFEEAAFGAAAGETVGPIETSFGLHLIQVIARHAARTRPLAEVEGEIRAQLAGERSQQLAESRARELALRIAREGARSEGEWQALADGDTVLFQTTPAFGKDDAVPGIGRNADFVAAAFALASDAASEPVKVPRGWAILRLRETKPSRAPTLPEVEARVRAAAEREKAQQLAFAELAGAKAALAAGRTLAETATSLGLELVESGEFTKGGAIAGLASPRAVTEAALALAPGAFGGPVVVPEGAVLFDVVSRQPFDAAKFAAERDATKDELRRTEVGRLRAALLSRLRDEVGVSYDPQLVEALGVADPERGG